MYSVFISFKKTDNDGNDTEDFLLAQKLYFYLTKLGLNVFFSSKSLESIGSSRYKADIDDALDSASVMIVILTKAEYAMSQWVQYEWDSFYNDYLSGVKPNAKLFTLLQNVDVHSLPRTLRNVQSLDVSLGMEKISKYIISALPQSYKTQKGVSDSSVAESKNSQYKILHGNEITKKDINEAVQLDRLVYDEKYWIDSETCWEWHRVNPDIYIMVKDKKIDKVIAYVNVSPITSECYNNIKSGQFIDTGITTDMILSYDMPYAYCLYFSSVVIHPNYQNTGVFLILYNAIIEKFIDLGQREIFMKKMIADAVSKEGEKFCKMFGMTRVDQTNHKSTLYEVTLIPPEFRVASKMTKKLHDFYMQKYSEDPYLFDD